MLRKQITCLTLLILLLTLIVNLNIQESRSAPESTPTISIEPRQIPKLSVGETFTVNVTVKNAENVYAVQVDIRYDPYILDAIKIIEGPFLTSAGSILLLFNESRVYEEAEPPYAQVYFVAALTGAGVYGANGSGVLFTITFEVLEVGSTLFHFYPYPGGGSSDGTYFMTINYEEIIPILEDGFYGTPITLSVNPSKIAPGQNATISGQVLGVAEAINVTIYYRKEGGSWIELIIVQTNSTGHFVYSWKPPETGKYYIKVSAVVEDVPVESGEVSLTVEAAGLDVMLIVGIVIAIVVVVAVVAFALKRRRKS